MNSTRFTFKKEERLCSKKLIDKIFEGKKVIHLFPFSIYYTCCDMDIAYPAQVLFAVSKKNFKRAVDRNRIKRLCKEAYRSQKNDYYSMLLKEKLKVAMVVVYNHKEHLDYNKMANKLQLAIDKLLMNIIKK
ncbi:MAG: ribonuclease P protein component [Bacteroidota bacterium]